MFESVRACLNLVFELAISIFSEAPSVCVTYVSFSAIAVQHLKCKFAFMFGETVG
jgi:hypothetical protein